MQLLVFRHRTCWERCKRDRQVCLAQLASGRRRVPRPSEALGAALLARPAEAQQAGGLDASVERQDANTLVLWFIVRSGDAGSGANDVGATAVDTLMVSRSLLVDGVRATVIMLAASLELLSVLVLRVLLVLTMPVALLALLLPLLLLVSALVVLEVQAMLLMLGLPMLSVLPGKSELSGRCVLSVLLTAREPFLGSSVVVDVAVVACTCKFVKVSIYRGGGTATGALVTFPPSTIIVVGDCGPFSALAIPSICGCV